jgi:hypothetical protein
MMEQDFRPQAMISGRVLRIAGLTSDIQIIPTTVRTMVQRYIDSYAGDNRRPLFLPLAEGGSPAMTSSVRA